MLSLPGLSMYPQVQNTGLDKVSAFMDKSNEDWNTARAYMTDDLEEDACFLSPEALTLSKTDQVVEFMKGTKFTSKTMFASIFVEPFPLRVRVEFEDCGDIALCYDDAMVKIRELNARPDVQDKKLLRRQIGCLQLGGGEKGSKGTISYPFEQKERQQIPCTFTRTTTDDQGGNEVKEIKTQIPHDVMISYSVCRAELQGSLYGKQYKKGLPTNVPFDFSLPFCDGTGSYDASDDPEDVVVKQIRLETNKTTTVGSGDKKKVQTINDTNPRCTGWASETEKTVVSSSEVGFDNTKYDREGDAPKRGPGFKALIEENANLTAASGETMQQIQANISTKRNELREQREEQENILSAAFWPQVYNNSSATYDECMTCLQEHAPRLYALKDKSGTGDTFKYFEQQLGFVSSSSAQLYWFTFWHDFWLNNNKMKLLSGKEDVFGFSSAESVIYNWMVSPTQLEDFLKKHSLFGNEDTAPYLFFRPMIVRLFHEMARADKAAGMEPEVKTAMLKASWQVAKKSPDSKKAKVASGKVAPSQEEPTIALAAVTAAPDEDSPPAYVEAPATE